MKLHERNIKELFLKYTKNFKVVLVTGSRQVGKTTFLKSIKEQERKYVSLDDLELRALAKNDPKRFLEIYSPPAIIDEIQYAPNLLPYIKLICDNTDKRNLYWLTGSQKIQIMKGVSESLVGRMGVLEMESLSNREIIKSNYNSLNINELLESNKYTKDNIIDKMWNGSMPDVIYNKVDKFLFYKSYVDLYLERDIRELKEVKDLETFRKFLTVTASYASKVVNYSDIASTSNIDNKTAKSWLSILENTGLIKFIYQYKKDEYKRITTHPKLIFMDTGLVIYLLNILNKESLVNYTYLGFLYENYVISEIIKNNNNYFLNYNLSFYRDKNKNEIDLIITDELNKVHLYEVKMTDKPDLRMINNFKVFKSKDLANGGLICNDIRISILNANNKVIPISSIID